MTLSNNFSEVRIETQIFFLLIAFQNAICEIATIFSGWDDLTTNHWIACALYLEAEHQYACVYCYIQQQCQRIISNGAECSDMIA